VFKESSKMEKRYDAVLVLKIYLRIAMYYCPQHQERPRDMAL